MDLTRTRAKYDGNTAEAACKRKRAWDPDHNIFSLVLEDVGRPAKVTIHFVRALAAKHPALTTSQAATWIWQAIQAVVQGYTAQMIRTAEHCYT